MNRPSIFAPSLCALLLIPALLSTAPAAHAAESYDNCTGFITSLPTVITTPGTWCMKQDLSTALSSGHAIEIQTNNVTVDCNDFKLGGLAAGLGTTEIGIFANNRVNLNVRRCNVRGFYVGVGFTASTTSSGGGYLVEDNRFDNNTSGGIAVTGDGSVIRHNRVFDTGGATFGTDANGIAAIGSVDILDNIVAGVVATSGSGGYAYGVNTYLNSGASIDGNRVRGLVKDGAGIEFGIYSNGGQVALHGNEVVGTASPGGFGLACSNGSHAAKDNIVFHFDTAIDTCTDGGGNVNVP
jgi:parallel beta-helix repeat protein